MGAQHDPVTADLLADLYVEQGLSCAAVGARLGVSRQAVHQALVRFGIPTRQAGRPPAERDRLEDPDWLRRWHVTEGWSANRIAGELGVAHATVRRRLEQLGIHRPATPGPPELDADRVRRRHCVEGASPATIAAEEQVSEHRLRRFMAGEDIPVLSRADRAALRPVADPAWLRWAYTTEGMTMATIAERTGVSEATVSRWLRRHDIPVRGTGPVPDHG